MVVLKQAKRNRSSKKDKFEDDELIKLMRTIGYEFDNNGKMTRRSMGKRREENEKK